MGGECSVEFIMDVGAERQGGKRDVLVGTAVLPSKRRLILQALAKTRQSFVLCLWALGHPFAASYRTGLNTRV